MRWLRGLTKAALVKKVFDEARKPHNQARIKQMVSKVGGGSRTRPSPPR